MIDLTGFFYYITITLCAAITSIGVGIGESLASIAAISALNRQPAARSDISRAVIVGMALTETAAVIGVVVAFLLVTRVNMLSTSNPYTGLAIIGIACAISLSGAVVGIASSMPVKQACLAIARQPFFAPKIFNLMLITTSFIQTPIIFGFIIALLILYQAPQVTTSSGSLHLIGSGLAIGIGGIGPVLGLGTFAQSACRGIGFNRDAYNRLLTFTFMSQAFIETPIVLSLVVALILITRAPLPGSEITGIAALAAALCTGISTITPGMSSGQTAGAACTQIAQYPEQYSLISRASILAQGLIDSIAIYGWLVALMLIFLSGS